MKSSNGLTARFGIRFMRGAASALPLFLLGAPLSAQVLHVNDRWEECAFILDPALTQASWRQFVKEAGVVTHFRPLTSAEPLGARNFEVAVLQWGTRIDDASDPWNDTFSHPDPEHWLIEGETLRIPGLMVRAGVTDRVDVGGYVTKAPGSNYGFFGGQAQYAFLHDPESGLAAASRASFVRMYGPEDLSFTNYGLDLLVSRRISRFTPYAGVTGYLAHGHEKTSKVSLEDENVLGVQGTAGVAMRLWVLSLGAEVHVAEVNGYSFKVAFAN